MEFPSKVSCASHSTFSHVKPPNLPVHLPAKPLQLQQSAYVTILKIPLILLPIRTEICKREEKGVYVCRGKQHTDFHMNHLLNKYMHHNVELHEQKRQSVQN